MVNKNKTGNLTLRKMSGVCRADQIFTNFYVQLTSSDSVNPFMLMSLCFSCGKQKLNGTLIDTNYKYSTLAMSACECPVTQLLDALFFSFMFVQQ